MKITAGSLTSGRDGECARSQVWWCYCLPALWPLYGSWHMLRRLARPQKMAFDPLQAHRSRSRLSGFGLPGVVIWAVVARGRLIRWTSLFRCVCTMCSPYV